MFQDDDFNAQDKFSINEALSESKQISGLVELGFRDIKIGETKADEDFYMMLPLDRELVELETFEMLYDAIPLL